MDSKSLNSDVYSADDQGPMQAKCIVVLTAHGTVFCSDCNCDFIFCCPVQERCFNLSMQLRETTESSKTYFFQDLAQRAHPSPPYTTTFPSFCITKAAGPTPRLQVPVAHIGPPCP